MYLNTNMPCKQQTERSNRYWNALLHMLYSYTPIHPNS